MYFNKNVSNSGAYALVVHSSRGLWKVNLAVIFIIRALKPKLLVKQVASSERIQRDYLPPAFLCALPRGSRGSWQLNRLTHFLLAVVSQCTANITAFCTLHIAPACPTCGAGSRLDAGMLPSVFGRRSL